MSAPKGILKPSTPYVHAPPAKAGGSKLKHTLAVAQKSSKAKKARRDADGEDEDVDMNGSGGSADDDEDGSEGDDDDEEAGTDEEIERSKKGKAKATPKRKRPTTADDFGSTLQSLLTESSRPTKSKPAKAAKPSASTPADAASSTPLAGPSQDTKPPKAAKPSKQLPILSLSRAPLPPSAAESKLEQRAARALKKEKEEKEDRARVRDVVEGWSHPKAGANGELVGALEFEKGLRKTAQRGVIKLFNAILTAHKQSAENDVEIRSTKKHKEIPISGVKGFGKKDKDNVLGRGNKEELTKEGFLELVKRGTA